MSLSVLLFTYFSTVLGAVGSSVATAALAAKVAFVAACILLGVHTWHNARRSTSEAGSPAAASPADELAVPLLSLRAIEPGPTAA